MHAKTRAAEGKPGGVGTYKVVVHKGGRMRGKYKISYCGWVERDRGDDDVDKRPRDTSVNNIISLIQPKSPRVCYAANTHSGLDAPRQRLYR